MTITMLSVLSSSVSLFLLLSSSFSLSLSENDFISILKPPSIISNSRKLQFGAGETAVPPLGWIQGIQYPNLVCSGTSFATTNFALGVCMKDGEYSSYMHYILSDVTPNSFEFYIATFSDGNCTTLIKNLDMGSLDPNFVCYPEKDVPFSRTFYYYPGSTPPGYPYNGVLTHYVAATETLNASSPSTTCYGTVLKSFILNPDTCHTNYAYNASDVHHNYRTYKKVCTEDHPIIDLLFSDSECTVPMNTTNYWDSIVCQPATTFRENNLPELYLILNESQFDYENAVATCYLGPTTFVEKIKMRMQQLTSTSYLYKYILDLIF